MEIKENTRKTKNVWNAKNRQQINEKAKEYRKNNPDKFKGYSLKKEFGITIQEYNQLLNKQKGTCAICKKPETAILNGKVKSLAVDHCHTTGIIRGLLCGRCNPGIGFFKDKIELLEKTINYLKDVK